MKIFTLITLFFFSFICLSQSQTVQIEKSIGWEQPSQRTLFSGESISVLSFDDAFYDKSETIPIYYQEISIPEGKSVQSVQLNVVTTMPLSSLENEIVSFAAARDGIEIMPEVELDYEIVTTQKRDFLRMKILPVLLNKGVYSKLSYLKFSIILNDSPEKEKSKIWVDNSVLATGEWYKIGVIADGVYQIGYDDLEELGIAVENINPKNIHIYGNGNGMLPEANNKERYDDLVENAIYVEGEDDGVFNTDDYLLFYGQGPTKWNFNGLNRRFTPSINIYSDTVFYYLTVNNENGTRIENIESKTKDDTDTDFNSTISYQVISPQEVNVGKFGQKWFGQPVNDIERREYSMDFPHIVPGDLFYLEADVVARSTIKSYVTVDYNGVFLKEMSISKIVAGNLAKIMVMPDKIIENGLAQDNTNVTIGLTYDKPADISTYWLGSLIVNVSENLVFDNHSLSFNNGVFKGVDDIVTCKIAKVDTPDFIWDISNPIQPQNMLYSIVDDSLVFNMNNSTLRSFFAFTDESYQNPVSIRKIANQNLHSHPIPDMVIVSHPDFYEQAQRLKDFHIQEDGFEVLLTTPEIIYNEFSSGAQDPVAIRSLMRMFYEREGNVDDVNYLVLFGDASYDPKNRLVGNTNFVISYEGSASRELAKSFVSDDFFGLLDLNEGFENEGTIDIAIGRFPVDTPKEAEEMVDKLLNYSQNPEAFGSWCNNIGFITDDDNNNLHFDQGEELAEIVSELFPFLNINKIPIDAYQQFPDASGYYSPGAHAAVKTQISDGTLLLNYNGHGGELEISDEGIMRVNDIINWRNFDKLMVFITATCEFSRFDNPEFVSAGELVFLNPNGGAIAMMTTARPTYASRNIVINRNIYRNLEDENSGEIRRMGDVFRIAKNESGNQTGLYCWCYFGDPALKLSLPDNNINTSAINGNVVTSKPDTLRALDLFEIEGYISDIAGNEMVDFNGSIELKIYDKPNTYYTLGYDNGSYSAPFKLQNSVLFMGTATVTNGHFTVSGIIPEDINLEYGFGKLSYYATSDNGKRAKGDYQNIIIGGTNSAALYDDEGPEVLLYVDSDEFVSGGTALSQHPVLLAELYDTTGINYLNIGIGHELLAIVDYNTPNAIVLNDWYKPVENDFRRGKIEYPLGLLSNGEHTLTFKAWDMKNNFSTTTISFMVNNSASLEVSNVFNRPNPFSNTTEFNFNHTLTLENNFDVRIEIFDLLGRTIRVIEKDAQVVGNQIEPIVWNGCSSSGGAVDNGVYPYIITIKSDDGQQFRIGQKLIISR